MAISNDSNVSRKEYRTKCRQKMADHLWTKLGIRVQPEDVRLITTVDDLYRWRVVPGKEHLFQRKILTKHLSKHAVGAYRHLYHAIGTSLKAAAPESDIIIHEKTSNIQSSESDFDFNTAIENLKTEKTQFELEMSNLRNQIVKMSAMNEAAGQEVDFLKQSLEKAEQEKAMMLQKMQEFKIMVDFWRGTVVKSADDCLARLRLDTSS